MELDIFAVIRHPRLFLEETTFLPALDFCTRKVPLSDYVSEIESLDVHTVGTRKFSCHVLVLRSSMLCLELLKEEGLIKEVEYIP